MVREGQEVYCMWNVHQTVWKNVGLHTKSLNKKCMGCGFPWTYLHLAFNALSILAMNYERSDVSNIKKFVFLSVKIAASVQNYMFDTI